METDNERLEMQKAFNEFNGLMEPSVQWVRTVNAAPEPERSAIIDAWGT
jgi:hypothetical protein